MKKILFIAALVIAAIFFVILAFNARTNPSSSGALRVAASFYPLYFFAGEVGGDKAEVVNITPSGVEPHDYEPAPQEVALIENSRLLIVNGKGVEAWYDDLSKSIDPERMLVIVASEGLADRADPHVWLSPPLAKRIAEKIAAGFIEADPENRSYYEANAETLQSKLDLLDEKYKNGLGDCVTRDIITSHSAFGYLASQYGLREISIAGLSPEADVSPQTLVEIADFARKSGVKYIFFETLVSPRLAQTLADEIGAETLTLNPLEGLNDEELAQGKNYFTEMESNLVNLQLALQCRN